MLSHPTVNEVANGADDADLTSIWLTFYHEEKIVDLNITVSLMTNIHSKMFTLICI